MKLFASFSKQIRGNSLAKNSSIVFMGTMVVNFCAFLYHFFVGRILGVEKYSELAALLSIFFIINVPSTVLQTVFVKYVSIYKARGESGKVRYLFMISTKMITALAILSLILFYPFIPAIANYLHMSDTKYFLWIFLVFIGFFLSTINLSILQAFQKFTEITVINIIGQVLRLLMGIGSAFWGVGPVLLTNVFSNVLGYGISLIPLRFLFKEKPIPVILHNRKVLQYSIPVLIATLGIVAMYSQDVILVKHFFSSQNAGIYSSLSALGKIIFFASSSVGFVAFPIIAERKELKLEHDSVVWMSLLGVGILSFAITGGYFLFPELVVTILFGKAFLSATSYLGLFGIFISFYTLSYLLVNMSLAAGKTKVWMITTLGALVQIAAIYFFHATLVNVIWADIIVSASLFFLLLLYYRYAK